MKIYYTNENRNLKKKKKKSSLFGVLVL